MLSRQFGGGGILRMSLAGIFFGFLYKQAFKALHFKVHFNAVL